MDAPTYDDGTLIPNKYLETVRVTRCKYDILVALNNLLKNNSYGYGLKNSMANHIRLSKAFEVIAVQLGGKKFVVDDTGSFTINWNLDIPSKPGLRRTKLTNDVRKCLDEILSKSPLKKVWIGAERQARLKAVENSNY